MKELRIILFIVLLVVLFAYPAYSTDGPSGIVTFPFICEVTPTKHVVDAERLDTVFAIANTVDSDTYLYASVRNFAGYLQYDYNKLLTPFDISRETCSGLIPQMPPSTLNNMITAIGGTRYYVGYLEYDARQYSDNLLLGWAEIKTAIKAIPASPHSPFLFARDTLVTDSGFNGVSDFHSNVNAASVYNFDTAWQINTNQELMLRYKIANSDPDTQNWWIIMTPSGVPDSCNRHMTCEICDEQNHCVSSNISLSRAVTIVNVADYLPGSVYPSFPKSGVAYCNVSLQGTNMEVLPACTTAANQQYLGWSYQYKRGTGQSGDSLIFPIHRQVNEIIYR